MLGPTEYLLNYLSVDILLVCVPVHHMVLEEVEEGIRLTEIGIYRVFVIHHESVGTRTCVL